MRLFRSFGKIANGWLKFIVALLAVGWFGHQGLERIVTQNGVESANAAVISEDSQATNETSDEPGESSLNLRSFYDQATSFVAGPGSLNFLLGLGSAYVLGFVSRPGFDWFSRKRRVSAAKKRARLHEEDMELLSQIES